MVADGEFASAVAPDDGGSRVTAVSAREEKNLARATERLFAALRARGRQARQAGWTRSARRPRPRERGGRGDRVAQIDL